MKNYKKLVAAAAMAAILFTAFSFPAVRGVASEFLTVFRVESVQTINISQADIQALEKAFHDGDGKVDIDNFGKVEVTGKQTKVPVTMTEAAESVDFEFKLPPPGMHGEPELHKITGHTVNLTLDVNNINAMLQAPNIAAKWSVKTGKPASRADVDRIYQVFVPMNERVVADYATLVPGAAETVRLLRERGMKIGSTTGYTRSIMERILPLAADRGMAVLINRPFGRGRLFRAVGERPLPDWAAEIDCANWAQVFLKFIVSHPAVTCAIPATSQVVHMEENMGAMTGRLPDEALRQRMARDLEAV